MQKPNILFILIDDLGWRDLTCYGSSFYETPNLDRLAGEGMTFTNAYASCPVCSPTRASILSGKYPARVGITQYIPGKTEGKLKDVPYLHYLPLEEKSIASSLREHGYQTWHVGKWHLGDDDFLPDQHGFDTNIAGCHWGWPEGEGRYFSPYNMPHLTNGPKGEYLTDRLTEEALNLIDRRDPDKPFFLHLSHYAVHTPMMAPEHLIDKYREKARRLGLDQVDPIVEGDFFSCLHKSHMRIERRVLQSHPIYAAMVENLDTNLGRVFAKLDELALRDNTLVVFTSDNGGLSTAESSPTCNHPLAEGKGWCYEGGTRVCQIVRWPSVVELGSTCDTPVTSTDFYPTFLEACGADLMPDQHVDGVSLMPLLQQNGGIDRDAIFWHYPHYSNQGGKPASSIRSGNWKLIEHFETDTCELFDLASDISETTNLVEQQPQIAQQLHARLKDWQKEIEAAIPQPNPGWESKLKRPKVANNAYM